MIAVLNSSFLNWQFLVQERSMNCLKTVSEAAKIKGQGLQKEQQNEIVKTNFVHSLHPKYLIGPII